MRNKFIILGFFVLIISSYSQAKDLQLAKRTPLNTQDRILRNDTISPGPKYLIKDNGVGLFLIGQQLLGPDDGYVITNRIDIITEEGEDFEIPIQTISKDGQDLLDVEYSYFQSGSDTVRVTDIFILSEKFKTAEGIGLYSTLEEFVAAYPDSQIWFSYVSNVYRVETSKLEGVQFYLDGDGYKDEAGPDFDSDMTLLKPSEFKKGTEITKIRIYGFD